jgi:predicted RNase H-like HicB family nuclease
MVLAAHQKFRVIHNDVEYEFEAAEEGGYIARVPAYPSAISEGETFEEALENIRDGLIEVLATARKLGLKVPPELADVSGTI